jgi:hypothetical protein
VRRDGGADDGLEADVAVGARDCVGADVRVAADVAVGRPVVGVVGLGLLADPHAATAIASEATATANVRTDACRIIEEPAS